VTTVTVRWATSRSRNAKLAHLAVEGASRTLCAKAITSGFQRSVNLPNFRSACRGCVQHAVDRRLLAPDKAAELRRYFDAVRVPTGVKVGRVGAEKLLPLLAEGRTDTQVAVALDASERTVSRMLSDAMNEYGARTRFQLGYLVAKREAEAKRG
jgi:hypothetical protein